MARRDVVRLDTERLKMKDLLLSKMTTRSPDGYVWWWGRCSEASFPRAHLCTLAIVPSKFLCHDVKSASDRTGCSDLLEQKVRDGSGAAARRVDGGGGKMVRIDDGKGRSESTNTSKRLDTQLATAHMTSKACRSGARPRQQVLEKVPGLPCPHCADWSHQPQTRLRPVESPRSGGADRLGAALIGLESGASHQHSGVRDGLSEPRPPQREALSSALGRGVPGGMSGSRNGKTSSGGAAGSGGRWLLNPEGIVLASAAMKNGKWRGNGRWGRGARSARSPSLSDSTTAVQHESAGTPQWCLMDARSITRFCASWSHSCTRHRPAVGSRHSRGHAAARAR